MTPCHVNDPMPRSLRVSIRTNRADWRRPPRLLMYRRRGIPILVHTKRDVPGGSKRETRHIGPYRSREPCGTRAGTSGWRMPSQGSVIPVRVNAYMLGVFELKMSYTIFNEPPGCRS